MTKKQRETLKAKLTERQLEIIETIANSDTRKTAAAELGISLKTVDAHMYSAFKITGSENFEQLLIICYT